MYVVGGKRVLCVVVVEMEWWWGGLAGCFLWGVVVLYGA
jgi:hypothetical protein